MAPSDTATNDHKVMEPPYTKWRAREDSNLRHAV